MSNELEKSVRSAAQKIVKAIEDAGEMTVETYYTEVKPSEDGDVESKPRLAASTIVEWDGDSKTTIPMHQSAEGNFEVDTALLELHQRNVAIATEYRTRLLKSLVSVLQPRGKQP